jgi:voltage-gated potassium channel
MRLVRFGSTALWSSLLLISVIFAVFVLPVLPVRYQQSVFRLVYTIIYFTAILSLEKRTKFLLIFSLSTLAIEWISGILNFPVLLIVAKVVNILFFLFIVVSLIRQIATARKVSVGVIVDSVSGYLLVGMIFSILLMFIFQYDPGAFSYKPGEPEQTEEEMNMTVPAYFSFVTLATLGYGDIVPLKPYSRSLSTVIAVTGQFYIAVIVALLVGKFSSQQNIITDE